MCSAIMNDTFSYLLTMNKFRKELPDVSWIKITTITMISSIENNIDIQKIRGIFNKHGKVSLGLKNSNECFEWTLKQTQFYNQITLMYTDMYSTKSIKLFPNGSIQVAGCADLFDCTRVIKQLKALLSLTIKKDIVLEKFRVVMINSNFSINHFINLNEVANHFNKVSLFDVSFDPDRYSAVKVKFKPAADMKQVTVSIFGTGKVIVTGAETLKEIVFSYNIINQYINSKSNIKVQKSDNPDLFDKVFGYDVEKLVSFLEAKGFSPWNYTMKNYKINF